MRKVSVNANGRRIGEDHPRAQLTNAEVDTIREMHETERLGYRRLAKIFEVSREHVRDIIKCERRAQSAVAFKLV